MWKRIINFCKEWAATYNELNNGEIIYFTSFYGNIVWIHIDEEHDKPRPVQPEDR